MTNKAYRPTLDCCKLACVQTLISFLLLLPVAAFGQVQVTTQHNDNSRSGQNVNETVLTPANITSGQFGKLFTLPVDGYVYAQPLYVPNVSIPNNGVHNVLYVATEHDSVYAFDADTNPGNSAPLWHVSFINPAHGITTVSDQDVNCYTGVAPEIGITSTPVIDTASHTIYVLAQTKENGNFFHRLHALDIRTGQEKFGGPTTISGSVPGHGEGSSGGILSFDPLMETNRPGLLLLGNSVVIGWASNCDNSPFHGWLMAYGKSTLQQQAIWASTPNGNAGGFWMAGSGIAADASGNIFVPSGNGTFDTNGNPTDVGDSILRMTLGQSGLTVADYFTPYNELDLYHEDHDVGSGGLVLLPDQPGSHPHELVQSGKEGSIYVVDRDNMGHFNPNNNSQIVQNITGEIGQLFAGPAYWNNTVYFGGSRDHLKAFSVTNGLLSSTPTSETPTTFGYPGPTPSISANGTSNAIIWALQTDSHVNNGNAVLRAYDATNLQNELYDSLANLQRDDPGGAVRFAVPTIANGKVYVGAQGQVDVYGLGEAQVAMPVFSPAGGTYTSAQQVTISDATPGATIFYTTDGSNPNPQSPVYSSPITISQTTTLKAMAALPGYMNSNITTGLYTISRGGGGSLNYGSGFTSEGLALNGSAAVNGSLLRLTDGGTGEKASAWYATQVNVQAFTQDFSFQITNPDGEGITFVIQNVGTRAIGPNAAGIGYGAKTPGGSGGIPNSVAVKFDIYNNLGEGTDSTGLYINGASPTIPAFDMSGSGINLHSGDVFNVHMTYDGNILQMTITDSITNASYSRSWMLNIPVIIGSNYAYVGFTAACGTATATQDILNWTYAAPYAISYSSGFYSLGLSLNRNAQFHGTRLRLTDGGRGEGGSMWYSTPISVATFTTRFDFQQSDADADGMAFVIQNAGTTAIGPVGAGLAYGAQQPGGSGGIPNSIAVKFDLYNNDGEGRNSTGLYSNGASPTVPAIDLTSSGIDLHSGHPMFVQLSYDGTNLRMTLTDTLTKNTFQTSWTIDIPTTIGSHTAYVGFTGATGGGTSIQDVLNWVYTP